MADEKDYYAILQVDRDAKLEDIERAYKRLSGMFDPQKTRKKHSSQRRAAISAAYEVLRDPRRRRQYDVQILASPATAANKFRARILSDRFMILCGGIITISILVVLTVVVLRLIGSGGKAQEVVAQASPTSAFASTTPTPIGQTPGVTPPASPPSVNGDVITTADGLQYIVVRKGTGDIVTAGEDVTVNYSVWLQDTGQLFDSSFNPGRTPLVFALGYGKVIKGWDEGLVGMRIGELRRLIIPPELAYGSFRQNQIPANSTLIYDVEMLSAEQPSVIFTPTPAS